MRSEVEPRRRHSRDPLTNISGSNMNQYVEALTSSGLGLSWCCRLDWGRSVAGVDSLIDLVSEGVSVENNRDLLDTLKFRRKVPNVHSNVFRKDGWTERRSQMIFDQNLPVLLDVYLVN